MIKSLNKKFIILSLFLVYILIGSFLSITTGITSDEYHEQKNWLVNLSAMKDFIYTGKYESFLEYWDRYHGIAFQLISQPIQFLIKNFVTNINNVTDYGGLLISKHFVVFLTFAVSGIFFYLILQKITKDENISLLSTSIYLLYPYLFGHAQFNPKDIPFLSFWLITTYLSLKIFENLYNENYIGLKNLILFSLITAFLISIRIAGTLIFIQFFVSLLIYLEKKKIKFYLFLKKNYKNIFVFGVTFFIFLIILNPIFWHNPIEILNSIKWMGNYPQNIGTLTNGSLLYSSNLPSSYYFIWLFFKLPILILIGYCLFPLVENKIFQDDIVTIYYGTITITAPTIIILFILNDVAVYDELRHLLFIFPLIFITSFTHIFYFFKKKIVFPILSLVIIFFISENIYLNPYQYSWLNSFAKFKNIEKNFEVDYWGVNNKNISKKIIDLVEQKEIEKSIDVYTDIYLKEFLIPQGFKGYIGDYTQVDDAKRRPFIAHKTQRNVRRSDPKDCELIWKETLNYTFYKRNINVSTIWLCN